MFPARAAAWSDVAGSSTAGIILLHDFPPPTPSTDSCWMMAAGDRTDCKPFAIGLFLRQLCPNDLPFTATGSEASRWLVAVERAAFVVTTKKAYNFAKFQKCEKVSTTVTAVAGNTLQWTVRLCLSSVRTFSQKNGPEKTIIRLDNLSISSEKKKM